LKRIHLLTLQDYLRTSIPDRLKVTMLTHGLAVSGLYKIDDVSDEKIILIQSCTRIVIETKYIKGLKYTTDGFTFTVNNVEFHLR